LYKRVTYLLSVIYVPPSDAMDVDGEEGEDEGEDYEDEDGGGGSDDDDTSWKVC
jgi:hypothetical protein